MNKKEDVYRLFQPTFGNRPEKYKYNHIASG